MSSKKSKPKQTEKVLYRTVIYSDGRIGKMKVDFEKSKKMIEKLIEEDKQMLEILEKL